jgi:hypothetical protein
MMGAGIITPLELPICRNAVIMVCPAFMRGIGFNNVLTILRALCHGCNPKACCMHWHNTTIAI